MATRLGSSPSMSGNTITNVTAPAGSAGMYVNNINTHAINAGATGSPAKNVTISSGSINAYTVASTGSKGDIKFTPEGNILAYNGTDWEMIAGLDDNKSIIAMIKQELCANFPDAAFDLMMKGLL